MDLKTRVQVRKGLVMDLLDGGYTSTKKKAQSTVGEFSLPSKMPCKCWSLPPSRCGVGSKLMQVDGSVCANGYCHTGHYGMPTTQGAMDRRFQLWEQRVIAKWIADFVIGLGKVSRGPLPTDEYFRWFDNGDIYNLEMLADILCIASICPLTRFWLPTKEYSLISRNIDYIEGFDNVTVRVSLPMINQTTKESHLKRYRRTSEVFTEGATPTGFICPAYKVKPAKCGTCRACWNKDLETVAYPYHGKTAPPLWKIDRPGLPVRADGRHG